MKPLRLFAAMLMAALLLAADDDGCQHNEGDTIVSTPYAGDPDLYPATIPIPDGSDRNYASVFNAPYSGLADRTAWLAARLIDPLPVDLFAAQQTDYAQASVGGAIAPRFLAWPAAPSDPPAADFERAGWLQSDVTSGGGLWWFIPIRYDTTITMIAAYLRGDDGPGTNPGFPAAGDRPLMRFYRQPLDGSDRERLLTVADESASKAEYEAHHTIPANPSIPFVTPLELFAGDYLVIEFVGHKGANVANRTLKLYGIAITQAPTDLP